MIGKKFLHSQLSVNSDSETILTLTESSHQLTSKSHISSTPTYIHVALLTRISASRASHGRVKLFNKFSPTITITNTVCNNDTQQKKMGTKLSLSEENLNILNCYCTPDKKLDRTQIINYGKMSGYRGYEQSLSELKLPRSQCQWGKKQQQ